MPSTSPQESEEEPAVDASRFLDASHPQWPGHWASPPASWDAIPDERLIGAETRDRVLAAIACLPPRQQQVIALRDVHGWSTEEVCATLDLSEANQRVLLHRARAKVRAELAGYLGLES